ncbi:MAG TPA: 3-isopropylmalate dehydratase small subunit [Chthonomonadales bacterium]|nr:3-isopropylmalate dehydratase small subunit [Chthonomonadales bacterium]
MEPFVRVTGVVAPLDRANVDTDQIMPKQFLKRVERTGFGQFLFFDWRYLADGSPDPAFELNRPGLEGATILATGRNFGSGSSREHAPWALKDYGFRAIVAPSFADIFYNNCLKNGLLPVVLPEADVRAILARAASDEGYRLTVDLDALAVFDEHGFRAGFQMDAFRRDCLLRGLDDIALTEQRLDAIGAYEARRPRWLPRAVG